MTLPALLDLFQRNRAKDTGVWKLGQEPNRTIFLDNGDIVFAQSTHPQDRLTYILVERGLLTQDQLDYAMANLKPGISVGKNLIDMGFITQRVLLDVARLQVERVVWASMALPDEEPQFTAKELEANIVRLPFETPLLLLNGLLAMQDRETMLDLLGPLNQVIVLESRRVQELSLPPDLLKLPALLDGTRTLLELARESGVEPMRLGAFALFLREMGWARLHEWPPLDRAAVDLALSPEPEPASPPLPESNLEMSPSLFSSIAAASKPTTNLEHLSEALDELPNLELELEPLPEPEETPLAPLWEAPGGEPVEANEGQAMLETPVEEHPLPPDAEPETEPEPVEEPRIQLPLDEVEEEAGLTPPMTIAPPEGLEVAASSPFPWKRVGLIVLVVGLAGFAGWRLGHRPKAPAPLPAHQEPVAPPVTPTVPPAETKPEAEPEPPIPEEQPTTKPVPPPPEKKPEAVAKPADPIAVDSKAARVKALRQGNLAEALAQGEALVKAEPKAWTLRLMIACKEDTLKGIPKLFQEEDPDLFVLPVARRSGQTCTQVFVGRYPSAKDAEAAIGQLPAAFQVKGNRPKAFLLGEIPRNQ